MNIVLMQTGNELSEIKLQALLFIIFTRAVGCCRNEGGSGRQLLVASCPDKGAKYNILHMLTVGEGRGRNCEGIA